MADVLNLAQRLWPQVRDTGTVDDAATLDTLMATLGQPGAPGFEGGERHTFAAFLPSEDASDFALTTGERPADDADGRFIAHILGSRALLGAGLHVDRRVQQAAGAVYAQTWCVRGGYSASPLAVATSRSGAGGLTPSAGRGR